ncbi:hypothetical protein [Nocardioides sp.]|uniref:hypothetical protein n=1 Tax=Nocardioides sp. TaxID=35761 RepID=UPI002611C73F|nr:hypothetical protein [Nocardioides sp.]
MAQEVRWRHAPHQLAPDSTVEILRFEVADLVAVIKSCVAASELYDALVEEGGLTQGTQVVPISCFAVTDDWTPQALAEGTRYASYRLVEAAKLIDAGFLIWPTDVFNDGQEDPRNEVHFDVIVAWEGVAREEFASTDKKVRAQARDRLRPAFEELLSLLGEPQSLEEPPT